MKNILVTGGLGYIGSHTVVALQQAGFNTYIIDNLSNSQYEVLNRITEITGKQPVFEPIDLQDSKAVYNFFEQHKIQGVVHFAAYKAVGESVEQPLMYYRNNLLGLINLLEAMKEFNVDHLIFSSSCTVYGQADQMPINEHTPLKKPEAPYGNTKKMGEEIIEDFVVATHKNAIALRYFNPIGAHPSALIGERPNGIPNNLIPYVTQTAMGIREELGVFGDDYQTRDGTAIRDYIDVNDLAQAHVKAMQYLLNGENKKAMEFFNLGSGIGSTVLEIIDAFEKANNINIPYQIKPRRSGDIEQAYADYTAAEKLLGWKPSTPLQQSLKTAWAFQKRLEDKK